ncbi:MAG: PAP/fibrillin family protein [Pseudomonadota bacterium]
MRVLFLSVLAIIASLQSAMADEASIPPQAQVAKDMLLTVLAQYQPGAPITGALKTSVDAAAKRLEATNTAPVNLNENEDVRGLWVNLFSSQGIMGDVDVAFMTRTLPGGGKPGGKAIIQSISQELVPEQRFYRNMMVMTAGEKKVPILYIATADLGIASDRSNDLEVLFHTIVFAPGGKGISNKDVRGALALDDTTPLSIDIPITDKRKASRSTVTYLDHDLRINRGKDYIAILRKVH